MATGGRPEGRMPENETGPAPDSRPARREATEAAVLWLLALVATVGLSTWLGSMPVESWWGVPRWAAGGIFVPWLLFFGLHIRFCRRRPTGSPER